MHLGKESVSICSTSLAQKDAGCDGAKQDGENSLYGILLGGLKFH